MKWLSPYVNTSSLAIFFMASGFLFSHKGSWKDFIKKKVFRLMIPYTVFCLLTITLRFAFAPFTHSGAPSLGDALYRLLTGGYYWFLYALFLIMIVCKLVKNLHILLLVGLILEVFAIYKVNMHVPIMGRIANFLLFFVLGMMVKKYYVQYLENWRSSLVYLLAVSAICYFSLVVFSQNDCIKFVNSIIGCVFIWTSSLCLVKSSKASLLLSYFGKQSLQFYLNHLLIMLSCYYIASFLPLSSATILWTLIFVMAVAISWVMLLVEKRLKKIHILFGL